MPQEPCVIYRARVFKLKSDAYFENINGQTALSLNRRLKKRTNFFTL